MELFSDGFKELVKECVEDPETVVLGACRRARGRRLRARSD